MMNWRKLCLGLGALALLLFGGQVRANPVPGIEFTTYNLFFNGQQPMGYEFQANAPVAVVALGYFADSGFNSGTREVGLFTAGGVQLADVLVTPADQLIGHFFYAPITPVNLTPGQDYVVAGQVQESFVYGANATTDPRITYMQNRFNLPGTSFGFPVISQSPSFDDGFLGGTVGLGPSIALVPEPSTLALLGIGSFVLASKVWRRKLAKA
jgi:hypothetical protein